jgi:hypothetical protein
MRDLDGLGTGWYPYGLPDPYNISPHAQCSFGGGILTAVGATAASTAWAVANQAIFVPFTITVARTYQVVLWMNGATVAGTNHIDIGVYSATGAKQFTIGSTVQTGVSTTQQVTLGAAQTLQPGTYFLATCMDTNTDTLFMSSPFNQGMRAVGMRRLTTFFPLGADASAWVGSNSGVVPTSWLSELVNI